MHVRHESLKFDGHAISQWAHVYRTETFINHTHACVGMASKNITISEEAYRRLENLKRDNESFSLVIARLTGKRALGELFGELAGEDGKVLVGSLKKLHRLRAKAARGRSKRLREALN